MLEKVTCLSKTEHVLPISWVSLKHTWVLTPSRPWACLNGMGWDTTNRNSGAKLTLSTFKPVVQPILAQRILGWEVTGRHDLLS